METLNLIKNDPWLEPFADAINGRHQHAIDKESELTNKGKLTLSDFASGYLYFGLHRTDDGWVFLCWSIPILCLWHVDGIGKRFQPWVILD